MIVIRENELHITCDAGDCKCYARYVVVLKHERITRLYCAVHTAELLQRAAKVLQDGESLDQFIETEHIDKGLKIEAT